MTGSAHNQMTPEAPQLALVATGRQLRERGRVEVVKFSTLSKAPSTTTTAPTQTQPVIQAVL